MSTSTSTTVKKQKVLRVKWNRIEPVLKMRNENGDIKSVDEYNKEQSKDDQNDQNMENSDKDESKDEVMDEGSYSMFIASPIPRFYSAATSIKLPNDNAAMLLFGGYRNSILNDTFTYEYTTGEWSQNLVSEQVDQNTPQPRYGHSLVTAHDGKTYVFGGKIDEEQYLGDMFVFNHPNWSHVAQNNPIKGRAQHSMVAYKENLYLFGGSDDELLYDELFTFNPSTSTWSPIEKNSQDATWPSPRDNHSAVVINDCMYVFGGTDNETSLDELWKYEFSTNEWTKLTAKGPTRRAGHAAVSNQDYMFIYGGCDEGNINGAKYYNETWVFNTKTNKWRAVQFKKSVVKKEEQDASVQDEDLQLFVDELEPVHRSNHTAVINDGTLYTFGGFAIVENAGQQVFDDFDTCKLSDVVTTLNNA
ncbi:actin-fragmin kinase [Acrasis kona]|uniref:Actin-fragmin kinase n=1 Tax=Acrasis kona TaxID=1008807 RepID=A0AAW2Z882_9EUKA